MNEHPFELREKIKVVSLFQRFVLGRWSLNIRIKAYEDLILFALLDSSVAHPVAKRQLLRKIHELLGTTNDIPDAIVTKCLQNLQKNEKTGHKEDRYWIKEPVAKRLRAEIEAKETESAKFYNSIARRIIDNMKGSREVKLKDIPEKVKECIAKIFEQRGLEVVQPLAMGKPTASTTDFQINNLIIDVTFKSFEDETVLKAAEKVINDLFAVPDGADAQFLYSVSKSYILLQALNLDPSCSSFQKRILDEYVLFVDSNVLLRAMAKGGEFHEFYDVFLRTCAKLHNRIYVTDGILGEVLYNIESAVHLYPCLSRNRLLMQEYRHRFERDRNIFIDSFLNLKEKEEKPPTWPEYIYELYSHDDPDLVIKTISHNYKIKVFPTDSVFQQEDWKYIAWISELISKERLYERRVRPGILADNEGKQFVLIYKKRREEKQKALGKLTWFITTDSIIPRVNLLVRKEEKQFNIPCSYTPTKWYQFIEIFAKTERKPEVFVELLGSSMMRAIVPSINDDLYEKFTEGQLPKTKEGYERLLNIVNQIADEDHVQRAYQEYMASLPADRLEKYEAYSSLALDRFNYLINMGFEEIKQKERRIKELERRIAELEQTLNLKKKKRERYEKSQRRRLDRKKGKRK